MPTRGLLLLAAAMTAACAPGASSPSPTLTPTGCGWPLPNSTATASVSILSCDFMMPQLGRARRVWLYLPPGYDAPGNAARYPVLYMHDGQNVFDAATSYVGEWGVDEALDALAAEGVPVPIVVAVDHGNERRLDEYSPWRNDEFRWPGAETAAPGAGGEGDAYVSFLVETLKPFVDARFRTRPDREDTGIMGSSMGGLISLYAALRHPDVFGRVGVFSPAFWFAPAMYDWTAHHLPLRPGTRVYMVTGGNEGDDPEVYSGDHERHAALLRSAGTRTGGVVEAFIRPEGIHNEGFWRAEFPAAYRWLFAPTNRTR